MSIRNMIREEGSSETRIIDCVEIYLPKSLKHLSELYSFLRAKVTERLAEIVLEGFSIYEVDGVFRGRERLWEERSLVIRILFPRPVNEVKASIHARISELGREIAAKVATSEEEVWVCHYPQSVSVFRPVGRILE